MIDNKNLIFTHSGIRGVIGKGLNFEVIKKITIALCIGLKIKDKTIIIGKDTRPSSNIIEKALIEGLEIFNCKIINLGICPSPIIIYMKNKLNIPIGIIISGSHNPPEWNALKILSERTFITQNELNEISNVLNRVKIEDFPTKELFKKSKVKIKNPIRDYMRAIYKNINFKNIKKYNNLRVVIDTGAGAGKVVTPKILKKLGCTVKIINNKLDNNNNFPRQIEPIEKNLETLISILKEQDYDIGFAHDSDADRLAIIGNDGTYYSEDLGLALIADYYFKKYQHNNNKVIFVTNLASSLIFEALAEKYNFQIIRTSIGECNLILTMDDLIKKNKDLKIFGGEGSCGGIILPEFNFTRDGVFAAVKIIEILIETKKSVNDLIAELPKFYTFRDTLILGDKEPQTIIYNIKSVLVKEGQNFSQVGLDLIIRQQNNWFILIHPSNTEPIIRIISEANKESIAKENMVFIMNRIKTIF